MTGTRATATATRGKKQPRQSPVSVDLDHLAATGELIILTGNRDKNAPRKFFRRALYRHRFRLAPVAAAALIYVTGAGLYRVDGGPRLVLLTAGLLTAALLAVGRRRRHSTRSKAWLNRRIERLYAHACLLASGLWLWQAARDGVGATFLGQPLTAELALAAVALAWPWWRHHKVDYRWIQGPGDKNNPDAADAAQNYGPDHPVSIYRKYVGAAGAILPGSHLTGWIATARGWTGKIKLARGKQSFVTAMAALDMITSAFDVTFGSLLIEPLRSRKAAWAKIIYYKDNPLRAVINWPGPSLFNVTTGLAYIGLYHDGKKVPYEMWRRNFGAPHDLIAGTTGSGKSRLLDMLLAMERAAVCPLTGRKLVTSIVLDPQMGQSLPEWKKNVAKYARGEAECLQLLYAIRDAMLARNKYMSDMPWLDEKNRWHEGRENWWPQLGDPTEGEWELPTLLSVTIDEAHKLCAIPEALKLLEEIAVMGRKCGVKLRLVVQVPLLDQLHSTVLREQVKGGNVIILRTADPITGQVAFSGTLAGDPHKIPPTFDLADDETDEDDEEAEVGETTAGLGFAVGAATRPSMMRLYSVRDPYHWAHLGDVTALGQLDLMAAPDYWDYRGAVGEDRQETVSRPSVGGLFAAAPAGADQPETEPAGVLIVSGKRLSLSAERVLRAVAAANGGPADRAALMQAAKVGPKQANDLAAQLIQLGLIGRPPDQPRNAYVLTDAGRQVVPQG